MQLQGILYSSTHLRHGSGSEPRIPNFSSRENGAVRNVVRIEKKRNFDSQLTSEVTIKLPGSARHSDPNEIIAKSELCVT